MLDTVNKHAFTLNESSARPKENRIFPARGIVILPIIRKNCLDKIPELLKANITMYVSPIRMHPYEYSE